MLHILDKKPIPTQKEIDTEYLVYDIACTQKYLDTLAMDGNPDDISLDEYNQLEDTHLDNMYRVNLPQFLLVA